MHCLVTCLLTCYLVELSSLLNFSKVVTCSPGSSSVSPWAPGVSGSVRCAGLWSRGCRAGLWPSWPPSWCAGRWQRLSTTIWNTDNNLIDKNLARHHQQCFMSLCLSQKLIATLTLFQCDTLLSILQGDVQLFTSPLHCLLSPAHCLTLTCIVRCYQGQWAINIVTAWPIRSVCMCNTITHWQSSIKAD